MESEHLLNGEEETCQAEKMISDKGYYPVRITPEEIEYYNLTFTDNVA